MTQSIGIVGAKEVNQNGKQKICIDGQWYYGGNTDVSSLNVGQRIDFEWNLFGTQNNLRGLQSWGLTPNQPTAEEIAAAKPQERKPWAGKGGGGGFSRGQDRGLEIDLQCMRFIGQTVAAAIGGGLIKDLQSMKDWTTGAFKAIEFAKSWGGTAPVSTAAKVVASSELPQQQGSPGRPPQGARVRPTGNFGWGDKCRDVPWNVLGRDKLEWFRDKSGAPSDIKRKCEDELFFRDEDAKRAAALAPQDPPTDDFDDDIPF